MKGIYISKDFLDRIMKYIWFIVFIGHTAFKEAVPGIQTNTVLLLEVTTFLYLAQEYYSDKALKLKNGLPTYTVAMFIFVLEMYLCRSIGDYSNPNGAILSTFRRISLPMILCMELYVTDRRRMNDILKAFALGMTVFSIVITGTTPVAYWGHAKLYGTFTGIQRNLASVLFVLGMAVCVYLISELKEKKYYFCFAILFVANLITGSRKGIIQIGLVLGLFFVLSGSFKDKLKYIRIVIIVGIIGAIAFWRIPWLQEKFGQRMLAVFDDSIEDTSIAYRDAFRAFALIAFADHPILGNGYDAFCIINEQITGIKGYSHCNYTELLCDYGLVGFILYYFNYARAIISGFMHRKNGLAKLAIYSMLPVFVIEYGQVTYYQPSVLVAFMLLFCCAKIAAREARELKLS